MAWLLGLLVAVVLVALAYQDFRSHSVSLWLLVALALGAGTTAQTKVPFTQWALHAGINWGFIALQMGLIKLLFTLKRGAQVQLADGLIGWGDILFLLASGLLFSPGNFLVFYISGLTVVLLGYGVYTKMSASGTNKEIPLAGGLSLWMLLFLVLQWSIPMLSLQNDDWLMDKLVGL